MKLSLILPVYNVEKFVKDCLNSLLCQDIKKEEYEIVCIDDGSTDGSAKVIEEYAQKNGNIKLFKQKNSGVSRARNEGLIKACGEYVWFIDPDDYIAANCFNTLLSAMDKSKADVSEFVYTSVEEKSFFDKEETEINIFEKSGYSSRGGGCQYIVRREYLLKNCIYFNEDLAYGEDYLWAFQVNYRQHVGLVIGGKIYMYRQRQNSAMNSKNREKSARKAEDMHRLALLYKSEYERCVREGLPKDVLKNVRKRIDLSVQSYIIGLVSSAKTGRELKDKLAVLKSEGLYPYRTMWWHLFDKNIGCNALFRLYVLLMSHKWYVLFIGYMRRFFRRNK